MDLYVIKKIILLVSCLILSSCLSMFEVDQNSFCYPRINGAISINTYIIVYENVILEKKWSSDKIRV